MKHKIEIILTGVLTTIDIFLDNKEVSLREINDNEYYSLLSDYEAGTFMELKGVIKGWYDRNWELIIKSDSTEKFKRKGTFDIGGEVEFGKPKPIKINL